MKKFGFYVLGIKGYECLNAVIDRFGSNCIGFVVSSRDKNIEEDCFDDIRKICIYHRIFFSERGNSIENNTEYNFAIGWRWINPDSENLIIFHDSLLPKYRGFAPLVNALINGETEVGVTAIKAENEYDSGDIISQKSIKVEYPLKVFDAIKNISTLYCQILLEICGKIISDEKINFYPQNSLLASYSPWRNNFDYKINWGKSSRYIARFIDAVGYPYKGAQTIINNQNAFVLDYLLVEDVVVEDRSEHIGKVIFMDAGLPTIICGEGLIQLKNIVDQHGDSMIGKIPFRSRLRI